MSKVITVRNRLDMMKPDSFLCGVLGSLGYSTAFISQRTHLTHCQISYRLKKAGIKRSDYRDGKSDMAQYVLTNAEFYAAKRLKAHLRKIRLIR